MTIRAPVYVRIEPRRTYISYGIVQNNLLLLSGPDLPTSRGHVSVPYVAKRQETSTLSQAFQALSYVAPDTNKILRSPLYTKIEAKKSYTYRDIIQVNTTLALSLSIALPPSLGFISPIVYRRRQEFGFQKEPWLGLIVSPELPVGKNAVSITQFQKRIELGSVSQAFQALTCVAPDVHTILRSPLYALYSRKKSLEYGYIGQNTVLTNSTVTSNYILFPFGHRL